MKKIVSLSVQPEDFQSLCKLLTVAGQYANSIALDTETSLEKRNQAEELYARIRCVLAVCRCDTR